MAANPQPSKTMIAFQHLGHCLDNKTWHRCAPTARADSSPLARSYSWLLPASAQKTAVLLAVGLTSLLSGVAIG